MSTYHYDGTEWTSGGGGTVDDTQGRYTVKRNNLVNVQQMLDVGRTYLGKGLTYGQVTVFDRDNIVYQAIDCSAFTMLTVMGIPYNDSPYYTNVPIARSAWQNNANYPWTINLAMYKKSTYADGHAADTLIRNAAAIGHFYYDRNAVVPMTNGFRDVEPGDIVFYAYKNSSGNWYMSDRWMHIAHIEIIATKEAAPDTYVGADGVTYTWDKTKYPYKHGIIGVRTSTPTAVTTAPFLENGHAEDPADMTHADVRTACLIVRPDLGALAGEAAEVVS